MRIVDRTAFLALPAGNVFMKFPEQPEDGGYVNLGLDRTISIKGDTTGNDFGVLGLLPEFEGAYDGGDWADVMMAMIAGEPSPPTTYEIGGRDGLFDQDQLFLVWEKDDLQKMIAALTEAMASGYQ